jgi:Uma2 family endonuclease
MTSKTRPVARPNLTLLPDPPEEERDMQQLPHMAKAILTLRAYFKHSLGRTDVLVNGEGYLCRRAGEARRSPHPDCLVALNLPFDPEFITGANGYTIEEVGQPPHLVIEMGSPTSGSRDYTVKRDLYAALDVAEYWRLDHSGGRFHDVPLAGERLVEGEYQPLPITIGQDGVHRGYSEVLGLELHWDNGQLRFYEPAARQYIPDLEESWAERDQARTERDQAQARVRELEEELHRLRGE